MVDESVPLKHMPKYSSRTDIVGRILRRTHREGDCIVWDGYRLRDSGYGTISWDGRDWVVHRAIYTALVGPIPEGSQWTIDHLCRNRACVNVAHMEIVTRGENSRRGGGLERAREVNRNRDFCKNGLHPWTAENIYTGSDGGPRCRPCNRETRRRWAAARRAAGETA